jgi:CubicO group peptidase (beta-lactamase class C family)
MNSGLICRMLFAGFAVGFDVTAFPALADTLAPHELTAANLEIAIDTPMWEWIDNHKGPGAVVVVVTRDAQVFAKGYGFADIQAQKPFTADATLVRPGSISKLFTGIAVMQLVDQGKLDLDRDINDYIDFAIPTPQGGVPVTLRRLLTHRAGFEEHVKGLFSRDREPQPLGRWLAENMPRRLFPKGDVEAYSNYGVALAGYIVERVSGEPYAAYVQRHILGPLGMRHSTFQQPLPDDLAPLMAKGYRQSDKPPWAFFETTAAAPAGALSATADDMGRFIRALINGGELDGVRILSKARLDEMMAPAHATPAGYLGLAFFGTKVAGHDAVGHEGATMTFFSHLTIFPKQGIGVLVSRDGIGEIKSLSDLYELPNPARVIAQRFLPEAPAALDASTGSVASDADVAGIYQPSRRAESSFLRLSALLAQIVIKVDSAGQARRFFAIWPYGEGAPLKRVERNLYEGPSGARVAFVDDDGSGSYLAVPAVPLLRVPWSLDLRWIAPALIVSTLVALLTLLAWPVAALWRCWRKRQWSEDRSDRRDFLAMRLVLLVDLVVVVAIAVLLVMSSDLTIFNAALDPLLLALYALAWLGVLGALLAVWAAVRFWRQRVGSRWSRVHHALIAASSAMLAWVFLTFHIAGTTLNY